MSLLELGSIVETKVKPNFRKDTIPTTSPAKSVDETVAFSKRLTMIFRLAAGHRILV